MPLSVFQVLFKANFIFKDFQDSHVYSSTFQACANPDTTGLNACGNYANVISSFESI